MAAPVAVGPREAGPPVKEDTHKMIYSKNAPRVRGRYRLAELVRYNALRYLHDNGPSTAWKCCYAVRRNPRNNEHNVVHDLLKQELIAVAIQVEGPSTRRRLYEITDRGVKYMSTLGKMLELLGNKD